MESDGPWGLCIFADLGQLKLMIGCIELRYKGGRRSKWREGGRRVMTWSICTCCCSHADQAHDRLQGVEVQGREEEKMESYGNDGCYVPVADLGQLKLMIGWRE